MIAFPRNYSAATMLVLALTALASPASAVQRSPVAGQPPEAKASPRALVQGCGNLPKTEVVVNSLSQSTASTTFVDVAGSDTFLNVAGSGSSCVLVSFSAQAFAPGIGAVMRVRALLDGKQSIEGEISLAAESVSFADAHAYNFFFPSVSTGSHVFRMQYRSANADTVTINDFSFNIRHR